jgi:hypothetical protein
MTPDGRLDLATAIRANVAAVIALLERPTTASLDLSAAELTVAIARMEELQGELRVARIECPAKAAILALRQDVRRAARLLRNAWDLRIGRGRQVEYSETGEWVRRPLTSMARWVLDA